jgi:aryl-alcohol dehydrogenase-like predicted oxidoreductase
MQQPGITAPIVGVTKPAHLDDAIAATTTRLAPEDVLALEQHYVPHAVNFFA